MGPDRDRIDEVIKSLARIEGALFGATDEDEGFVQLTRAKIKAQDVRIKHLEKAVALFTGALAFMGWIVAHPHVLQELMK